MLTLALPTYNRAHHLERQLAWLAEELSGDEAHIEVLISDNASTDATPAVVGDWCHRFGDADLTYRRNERNIGAVANIASCIRTASRRHVWTIGDDDVLAPGALKAVQGYLTELPDLGLLTLNFSSRYVATGLQRFAQCYPVDGDRHDPGGEDLFTACLDLDEGGVALTTAQVYRADLARQAQRLWPTEENLVVQTYWSAFCAAAGGMHLTGDTYLECAAGTHHFLADPLLDLRLHFADTPELGAQLAALGYDPGVCAELTLKQLVPHHRATIRRAWQADPRETLRVLGAFTRWVRRAGLARTARFVGRGAHRRWQQRGQRLDRGRPSQSG